MPLVRRMRGVWESAGLIGSGRWGWGRKVPVAGAISRAIGFRRACEDLGGFYRAFAVFLKGRADLVPTVFQRELETIEPAPIGPEAPAPPSTSGLAAVQTIAKGLFSTAYSGIYEGRPVRLEVFSTLPEEFDERGFRSFRQGIAWLEASPEARAVAPATLADFESWLLLHCDIEKKRRMLDTLAVNPDTGVTFPPRLVPNLQEARVLAYEAPPLPAGPASVIGEDRQLRAVECVLEQCLILSYIPLDQSLDDLIPADEHRLGFRVWPFMAPVPVQQFQPLLQYTASCIADDGGRALRMLQRMTRNEGGGVPEIELWRSLSGLKFEVGTQEVLPETAERMMEYWRAMSEAGARAPLFLNLFHRTINRVAHAVSPGIDPFSVAGWTLLSRLVQRRIADSFTGERAREWMMGTTLLNVGLMRQVGVMLEQIRDNDLAVTVTTETVPTRPGGPRPARGMGLLGVFAAALAGTLWPGAEAWAPYLSAIAAVAALLLMTTLVRKAT